MSSRQSVSNRSFYDDEAPVARRLRGALLLARYTVCDDVLPKNVQHALRRELIEYAISTASQTACEAAALFIAWLEGDRKECFSSVAGRMDWALHRNRT